MTCWLAEHFVKTYLLIDYLQKNRMSLEKEVKSCHSALLCLITHQVTFPHPSECTKRGTTSNCPKYREFQRVTAGHKFIKTILLTKLKRSSLIKHFLIVNTLKLLSCKSECPLEKRLLITVKPFLSISK